MKDPLHIEQTPYDILGVLPGASIAQLYAAYSLSNARGVIRPIVAKTALDTLLNPCKRAMLDLLQYNDDFLSVIPENPNKDVELLSRARRADTLEVWRKRLISSYPNPAITHCLAVAWYWWTMDEDRRFIDLLKKVNSSKSLVKGKITRETLLSIARKNIGMPENCPISCDRDITRCELVEYCFSDAPPLYEMWRRVLGYWCALEFEDIWDRHKRMSPIQTGELRGAFFRDLSEKLDYYRDQYLTIIRDRHDLDIHIPFEEVQVIGKPVGNKLKQNGINDCYSLKQCGREKLISLTGVDEKRAKAIIEFARKAVWEITAHPEQYSLLTQELRTERETAYVLSGSRIPVRTQYGKIQCGPLILRILDLLGLVRDFVEAHLDRHPNDANLKKLKVWLSEYTLIRILLNNNKPEPALEIIEELPAAQKNSLEVSNLKAEALYILGQKYLELNQMSEGFECWAESSKVLGDQVNAAKVRKKISDYCMDQASRMQVSQVDEAINILEKGYDLFKSPDIKSKLAELLFHRGEARFTEAYNEFELFGNEPTSNTESIVEQMESGIADLERSGALGYKEALEHLEIVKKILQFVRLPGGIRNLVEMAQKNIADEKWDQAITLLEKAIFLCNNNIPQIVKEAIALALNNRGMASLDKATEIIRNNPQNLVYFRAVVEACLQSSYNDLSYAEKLNPSNRQVIENLRFIETILRQVNIVPQITARNRIVVTRNEPCPCGSGKKYKHCHGAEHAESITEKQVPTPRESVSQKVQPVAGTQPKRAVGTQPKASPVQSKPAALQPKSAPTTRDKRKRGWAHIIFMFILTLGLADSVLSLSVIWSANWLGKITIITVGLCISWIFIVLILSPFSGFFSDMNDVFAKRWKFKDKSTKFIEILLYIIFILRIMTSTLMIVNR